MNFFEPGGAKKYHHRCTIKEIILNSGLQYSWVHPSHRKGESMLTWELTPDSEYTKLTHTGIESFADSGSDFVRGNYMVGWNEIVGKSLKEFIEK